MNLTKQFFKYVSQNIFGLIGTSCYILADTYFIAQAAGTDGVTLLNLCLPMYNLIFAIRLDDRVWVRPPGTLLLQGAGRGAGDSGIFPTPSCAPCLVVHPVDAGGRVCARARCCGSWAAMRTSWRWACTTPASSCCSRPFFMCNYIFSAFVRNDGDPSLAMVATLSGSLFNVVFDYIFIFPMGLGLPGAALATAISPVTQHRHLQPPLLSKGATPCTFVRQAALGPAAGAELPAGHLRLCGRAFLRRDHHGVQLSAAAVWRATWAWQPTAWWQTLRWWLPPSSTAWPRAHSRWSASCYGKNDDGRSAKSCCCWAAAPRWRWRRCCTVPCLALPIPLLPCFNSESSALMAEYAHSGMRIYFLGYFFAGCNIVAAGYLGAVNRPTEATITSVSRGVAAIVTCSLILSALFGMNGVWSAFPAAEAITLALTVFLLKRPHSVCG